MNTDDFRSITTAPSTHLGSNPEPVEEAVAPRRKRRSTIGGQSVDDALAQYRAEMLADRRAERYIEHVCSRVTACANSRAWVTPAEFTDDGITAYLYGLTNRRGETATPKTRKIARGELATFLAWCVRRKKIDRNPIDLVDNPRISKARKVRPMTPAELQALIASVTTRKSGKQAADIYLLAFWTGFRRSDLEALCVHNVDLHANPPRIYLRADQVKERREVVMPIVAPEVVAMLQRRMHGKLPTQRLFNAVPRPHTFDADLKRAGIPKVDSKGQKLVLHSCRHGLATAMGEAGIDVRKVQKVMRHADIATTMIYTDVPETARASALTELREKIRPFALDKREDSR